MNDNKGLGDFTESGLENNNKFLRFYRQNIARKVNQTSNLDDCITRLWLRSDPYICDAAPKPSCSRERTSLSDHYTVSCPNKLAKHTDVQTTQTLDDNSLSI